MPEPVFITGIAGFLGSHVADAFLAQGRPVRGIDTLAGGYKENIPTGVEFRTADCRDIGAYADLLDGVGLVYHCAAAAYEGMSVFSPSYVYENTCGSSVAVFSAAIQARVRRIVFCSSMARYGKGEPPFVETSGPAPVDPYGIAKVAAEETLRSLCGVHGTEFSIAVPHNIIGPRQRYDDPFRNVASIMINRMLQGKRPIIYGDGTQQRCFSFVDDVVSCLVALGLSDEVQSEVVNVGPDEDPITILRLAQELADLMGVDCDPIFVPGRPLEVHRAVCSSDKARRLLGYETKTSLRDGLQQMIDWIGARETRPFDYGIPFEIITENMPRTWSERLI